MWTNFACSIYVEDGHYTHHYQLITEFQWMLESNKYTVQNLGKGIKFPPPISFATTPLFPIKELFLTSKSFIHQPSTSWKGILPKFLHELFGH